MLRQAQLLLRQRSPLLIQPSFRPHLREFAVTKKPQKPVKREKEEDEEEVVERHPKPEISIIANSRINLHTIRVIDSEKNFLGEMSKSEGLALAKAKKTDLVQIGPQICQIIDLSLYKYQLDRKEKERLAKLRDQKKPAKLIKFGISISPHDFDIKINHAIALLGKKTPVICIVLNGNFSSNPRLLGQAMNSLKNHGKCEMAADNTKLTVSPLKAPLQSKPSNKSSTQPTTTSSTSTQSASNSTGQNLANPPATPTVVNPVTQAANIPTGTAETSTQTATHKTS